MFKPISDNLALSQKIVSQITDAIVSGELHAGDRLPTERELALEFKVSRTAIRDAIKLLAGRGLLTVKHGVGIFVAEPATENQGAPWMDLQGLSLRDLFEVRKVLETEAAYLAAQRSTKDQIHRLEQVLQQAWDHHDNLMILNQCDASFHTAIAEASQNLLIVKIMWTLLDALENARSESLHIAGRPVESLSEHKSILESIKTQNPDEAKQRMLHHLESVEASVVNRMTASK